MKKLLTLSLLCAFAFSSSTFAVETQVENCGAYAESNSRLDGKSTDAVKTESEEQAKTKTSIQ